MSMLRLDVDTRDLERAPAALKRAWVRAGNRAVRKTSRWAITQGLRAIAAAEKIPIGALRRRKRGGLRIRREGGTDGAVIWFGVLPLSPAALGKPRTTKKGAPRVGRHAFADGTFVATMPNGHTSVWDRRIVGGRRAPRLPIVEQMLHLNNAPKALDALQNQIPARLRVVMAQELNFEMRRGGG